MSALRYVPVLPLLAAVGLFVIGAAVTGAVVGRRRGRTSGMRASAGVLLAGAVVAVLVLTQVSTHRHGVFAVSLVPGAGIAEQLANANRALGVLNVVGNAVMFAPLGLLTPLALRWTWQRTTLACLLLSAAIEVVQVLTGRSGDVDDVLLNTAGGAVGAWLGALVAPRLTRRREQDADAGADAGADAAEHHRTP